MGRYLQAIKNEVRNQLPAVVRGEQPRSHAEVLPPYYDERPPVQSYGSPASGELSPQQLQMIIEHAKLQGVREELERSRAHVDATHHAHADRMVQVALAAVNKQNTPVEIRYRGSAFDKKERRFGELKFAAIAAMIVLALIFIWWVKDNVADYQAAQAAQAAQQAHKQYKRTEEYDDR